MNPLNFKPQTPNNDCKGCHFDNVCQIKIKDAFLTIEPVQILDSIHGDCACSHIYVKKQSFNSYPIEL